MLRRIPPCGAMLEVREVRNGLDLRLISEQTVPGTLLTLAFDFAPGGIWETRDSVNRVAPGTDFFLREGLGRMRYGNDWIEVGPGCAAHTLWPAPDPAADPGCVRVLVALAVPADYRATLRVSGSGL